VIELTLADGAGSVISRNFYWAPSRLTTFDWGKTDNTHTPAHITRTQCTDEAAACPRCCARGDGEDSARTRVASASRQLVGGAGVSDSRRGADPVRRADCAGNVERQLDRVSAGRGAHAYGNPAENASGDVVVQVDGWNVAPQTITPEKVEEKVTSRVDEAFLSQFQMSPAPLANPPRCAADRGPQSAHQDGLIFQQGFHLLQLEVLRIQTVQR